MGTCRHPRHWVSRHAAGLWRSLIHPGGDSQQGRRRSGQVSASSSVSHRRSSFVVRPSSAWVIWRTRLLLLQAIDATSDALLLGACPWPSSPTTLRLAKANSAQTDPPRWAERGQKGLLDPPPQAGRISSYRTQIQRTSPGPLAEVPPPPCSSNRKSDVQCCFLRSHVADPCLVPLLSPLALMPGCGNQAT